MTDVLADVIAWAREVGFERLGPLDASTLEPWRDMRSVCQRNLCDHFGWTSSCPPECGEVQRYREKLATYHRGVLLQTSRPVGRDANPSEVMDVCREHGRRMRRLLGRVGPALPGAWALMGDPCDDPEVDLVSMEAAGLNVADVCRRNGLPLDAQAGNVTWVGCVLVD